MGVNPHLPGVGFFERLDRRLQAIGDVVVVIAGLVDPVHQRLLIRLHVAVQRRFERADLLELDVVEEAVVGGEQGDGLLGHRQRRVLLLLHQFGDALAALELLARALVEVGRELGEGRQFTILRQVETHAAAELHDDLGLRRATDARLREAGVDGGTHTGVEQIGFEINLAVGDRDHVGGHEGRHVTGLRFDDGQRGERSGLALHYADGELLDVLGVDARGALQQAGVQVEHIAGIGFAAGRTAQQQGHLAIGPGLLGQVVVHDQRVFAAVAEVFAHRAARVGRDELQRGGHGGAGGDDDGVGHGAVLFELAHHVGDRGGLLAHRHVDALTAGALLIDDGVDRDRGRAGLAVADEQFALTAADRHHRIDGLQAGLHGLVDRFTFDHARRDLFDGRAAGGLNGAFAVERVAQGVDHAAEQARADRHFQNAAGAFHRVAFGDVFVGAQHHRADRVALQVERHAVGVAREFDHFTVHHVGQTVDADNAVGDAHHGAFGARLGDDLEAFDALLDEIADFRRIQLHFINPLSSLAGQGHYKLRHLSQYGTVYHQVARANDRTAHQAQNHNS